MNRSYKRSWKNLLINKRYQLSFTLFIVGVASLLMIGLGIYVMHVANETTKVSKTLAQGRPCAQIPAIDPPYEEATVEPPTMKLDEPKPEPGAKRKIDVTLNPMEVPKDAPPPKKRMVTPPVPANFGKVVVQHYTCQLEIAADVGDLESGRFQILIVMVTIGFLLVLFLAALGIKMTHRVAGPLFKVQLYFAKMRDGRFDKVYNLRKGDDLVEFYDHFKLAHAGVVKREKADIERLRAVIEAAEAAGQGDHGSIKALREVVARKEKAIE